jgi:hypothetical protein
MTVRPRISTQVEWVKVLDMYAVKMLHESSLRRRYLRVISDCHFRKQLPNMIGKLV